MDAMKVPSNTEMLKASNLYTALEKAHPISVSWTSIQF